MSIIHGVGRPRPRPVHRQQRSLGPVRRRSAAAIRLLMAARVRAAVRGAKPASTPSRRRTVRPTSPRSTNFCSAAALASAEAAGGGFPGRPSRSLICLGVHRLHPPLAAVHQLPRRFRPANAASLRVSVATAHTLGPGISFTLPAPIDRVQKIDVENIRTIDLGSAEADDLMLTGDQNMHRHRLFGALEHPRRRSSICSSSPSPTRPSARSRKARCARLSARSASTTRWATSAADIEARVAGRDAADPRQLPVRGAESRASPSSRPIRPTRSMMPSRRSRAAQQDAQSYINQANAYALQLTAKGAG